MDIMAAQLFQPRTFVTAALLGALVLLLLVALVVAFAAGAEPVRVAGGEISPFRWA
jgi:hypothetical protein